MAGYRYKRKKEQTKLAESLTEEMKKQGLSESQQKRLLAMRSKNVSEYGNRLKNAVKSRLLISDENGVTSAERIADGFVVRVEKIPDERNVTAMLKITGELTDSHTIEAGESLKSILMGLVTEEKM